MQITPAIILIHLMPPRKESTFDCIFGDGDFIINYEQFLLDYVNSDISFPGLSKLPFCSYQTGFP